ncbi:Hsp20/alpha crystallin family protein [Thermanaerosceptrum fracticalcis]|uniref:Hsp20/alpha crystallin family protein n=1 Tax=Thermanaerosceptrum fracticalcis TaxID=1712410 RepID=UPI001FAD74DC|nr:Hsp20/alpha crystallin family protein [Thermanaerosceptrum fracticalcis]
MIVSLVEWNPFKELDYLTRDMANFLERSPFRLAYGPAGPKVDVYQTDTEVVVKAEIPGVAKEDLHVYVDENSVRLSGQTRKSNEFKDENVFRTERYYGSFSRTIPLPVEIKSDEAQAQYKDGILTIKVPKVEPAKTKGKRINIQ